MKTVQIGDKQAVSFVPELAGQLAIVDLNTLRRITKSLGRVEFYSIKTQFAGEIANAANLEEMVEIAKSEVAFHETCNLIKEYKPVEEPTLVSKEEQLFG